MSPDALTSTIQIQRPDTAGLSRVALSARTLAESFVVSDAETYSLAAEELTAIKARSAALDKQRKSLTAPLDAAKKGIMDLFRGPLEVLEMAEGVLKRKMLAYHAEEEARAAEARRAAQLQVEQERARLEAEAAELAAAGASAEASQKVAVAEMLMPVALPESEAPVKAAGIKTTKTIDFEVTDFAALVQHVAASDGALLHLLVPDEVRLRALVRGLGEEAKIPGVRVFMRSGISASRSRTN